MLDDTIKYIFGVCSIGASLGGMVLWGWCCMSVIENLLLLFDKEEDNE